MSSLPSMGIGRAGVWSAVGACGRWGMAPVYLELGRSGRVR